MLAYAVQEKGHYKNVHFSVVHHPDNHDLDKTMTQYSQMLKFKDVFSTYTLRDFITAAETINDNSLNGWIIWYKDLYLV